MMPITMTDAIFGMAMTVFLLGAGAIWVCLWALTRTELPK
jgi:hypothetical protein